MMIIMVIMVITRPSIEHSAGSSAAQKQVMK
jgi:hypothetical protein